MKHAEVLIRTVLRCDKAHIKSRDKKSTVGEEIYDEVSFFMSTHQLTDRNETRNMYPMSAALIPVQPLRGPMPDSPPLSLMHQRSDAYRGRQS